MEILNLDHIAVNYGKVKAIEGVVINVDRSSIVTLIGSNGAGKTTILKAIVGWVPLMSGKILFKEKRIDGLLIHDIVKVGIALCPEGRRVFPKMTVFENLKMGAVLRRWKEAEKDVSWLYENFPILKERKNQLAGSLSGGEQQMLAVGRALMSNPELLLLDEPSLGLAPLFVSHIGEIIKLINQEKKVSIVLVEQNSKMALKLAQKGYVIETGTIILEGDSEKLLNDEGVRKAYLGG